MKTDADTQLLLTLRYLEWQRDCRHRFIPFCQYALKARGQKPALHHQHICAHLEAVARGRCHRLMILAPPGSAKTTYVSRLFPAWFFAEHQASNIIGASHTAELAETNSAFVQRVIRDYSDVLNYSLRNDAKGNWETSNECRYRAIGVGGAVTGFRADIVVVDDPIRGRADAESTTNRAKLWDWFNADLLTRLRPEGAIVMIATPYHEDDLMGRLLQLEPDAWRVLRLPAIAEEHDALGRQPGEPLWNDDYGYGHRLLELRDQYEKEGLTRDWHSQYQCRPRPPEGAMFRPNQMPVLAAPPPLVRGASVRAWDLASSRTGDWTVGLRLDLRAADRLPVITDVRRMRGLPDQVRQLVLDTAYADGVETKIMLPQDPAQAGADQALSYVKLLLGFRVETARMSGNKQTRAEPVASQVNVARVAMLKANWNAALVDELGCAMPDTEICTSAGSKPIIEVRPNDYVMTRLGWRRVIRSGCTGTERVVCELSLSNGRYLKVTPNHPIWVPSYGFKPAGHVRAGESLLQFIGTSNSGGMAERVASATSLPRSERLIFAAMIYSSIASSMSKKLDRFRPMKTRPTMRQITSSVLRNPSIRFCITALARWRGLQRNTFATFAELLFGHSLAQDAMEFPCSALATAPIKLTQIASFAPVRNARPAVKSTWRARDQALARDRAFAVPLAVASLDAEDLLTVLNAERASFPAQPVFNFAADSVQVVSMRLLAGRHAVYNLEVEEAPEFVAEGVLVHNSFPLGPYDDQVDALALGFTSITTRAQQWERWRALAS